MWPQKSSQKQQAERQQQGGKEGGACDLSESELRYIEEGVLLGVRQDGRNCIDVRSSDVFTHVLPLCHASAAVRNSENAVLCGVQLQLGKPGAAPNEGLIFLGLDCSAAVGGRGSSAYLDSENIKAMQLLLTDMMLGPHVVDKQKLSILPYKLCWHVIIDCVVLAAGGCLLHAVSLAIYAALQSLRLPLVSVEDSMEDEEVSYPDVSQFTLSCDERESAGTPFAAEDIPIVIVVGQIGSKYVWDMSSSEEAASACRLAVAISRGGKRCTGLQTIGSSIVDPATFPAVMLNSQHVGAEILERVEQQLKAQQQHKNRQQLHAFMNMMDQL